jgi:cytochrome P450/NADPH-cytochrome P450 reductase
VLTTDFCLAGDWFHTYQITPALVQRLLDDQGATLFAECGATDASQGDILGDFERWETGQLWPGISGLYGKTVANNEPRLLPSLLNQDFGVMSSKRLLVKVIFIKKMTASTVRPKYHIELELPQRTTYNVGDYLEVYPQNSQDDLDRLLQAFRISHREDADPSIMTIFSRFELNQPATAQVRVLAT